MITNNRVTVFLRSHGHSLLFGVLLLLFIFFASFFAFRLNRGIIPDEGCHTIYSEHFATTWGIPDDNPETYRCGYIGNKPFLYYWINGRVLNLLGLLIPSPSSWQRLVTLRLLSVIYSTITVFFSYLIAREVIKNRWWQLLIVFMLTNTLMFVFLSGGVNYDSLANLCAFAGIYFLIRIFNGKPFLNNSLAWLIAICAGALVKNVILPLALIMVFVWVIYIIKNHARINLRKEWGGRMIAPIVLLVGLISMDLGLWGGNLLQYHSLTPPCEQILTQEQCNQGAIVKRDKQLQLPEKLTLETVVTGGYPDPIEYFLDYWHESMLMRIIGIMGHKHYFPDLIITFHRLFLIWVVAAGIRYWKKPSYTLGSLIAIVVFYTFVLFIRNYNGELITGFKHVAIQGRYIFPVLGGFYTLIGYFLSKIPNSTLRGLSFVVATALFALGSPAYTLIRYPMVFEGWFY